MDAMTWLLLVVLEFCPGMSDVNSDEYKMSMLHRVLNETKLCWSDALFSCRDNGLDLYTIETLEDQQWINDFLDNFPAERGEHVWIGLRRQVRGGTWFWMSGVPMKYTKWDKGSVWQNTSPCGGIRTKAPYTWTDLPCGTPLHFLCRRVPKMATPVTFWSSTRP